MLEKIGLKIVVGSVVTVTVAFSGFAIWMMANAIRQSKKDEKIFDEAITRTRRKYDELEQKILDELEKGVK